MQFPAAKGTGYHASSHIITSYVLKRNWKQTNPKESRALFWVWAGRAGWKITFFLNASLERHSCKSGSIPPLEIIPHRFFQQIGMHFPAGNHPSQTFPANQDAFPRWKSSLTDFSSKSGCISSLEIIPHGNFQQIRMHFSAENHPSRKFSVDQDAFPAGNHPSRTFPTNQDAFLRWESSLQDISSKSGCISPLGIIPPGNFQQIRMHFSARNHPSQKFPANQDAFPRWKSSLPDIFSKSRCISPTGIIPPRHFHRIRMHFSAGNHPSRTFPVNQDAFPQRESSHQDNFSKSGCISTLGIIPPEIIPLRIIPPQTIPSPTKKACPAYETGRVHSKRNSMRNHRENE